MARRSDSPDTTHTAALTALALIGPLFGVADATDVGGVLPPGAAVGVQAAASSAAAPITASTGSRKSPNRAFLVVCPVV